MNELGLVIGLSGLKTGRNIRKFTTWRFIEHHKAAQLLIVILGRP